MTPPKPRKAAPFVLGRARFEKIMAVEGYYLSEESRRMFEEFDRKGLTHEERRQFILDKHGVSAKESKTRKCS